MSGRFIVTAAEMLAAEHAVIDAGTSVETLMERAGSAAAEAIWRRFGPRPTVIACGPGNNGGDGYVIARRLAVLGVDVTVAVAGEPRTDAAVAARALWLGRVVPLGEATPRDLFVDSLFGTGLRRGLDGDMQEALARLAAGAAHSIAIDLPSGVASDDGGLLSPVPDFDLTVTFGALKPAHLLQPAARHMGRIVVGDIGVQIESKLSEIARPVLPAPGPDDHKYTRGLVTILAGDMPGASALAASAAARAGAGAVQLQADMPVAGVPLSVIQSAESPMADRRIGALVVGPGLPAGEAGRALLAAALASGAPLVIDAGALRLMADGGIERLTTLGNWPILTPHEGEFAQLFGRQGASKIARARAAAAASGAVIVYKGADTVVSAPDGRAAIAQPGSSWLASAGTGDVLAGTIAAARAGGLAPFEAACAGVWLHGRAAVLAGPALVADDLIHHLPAARAECAIR